MKAAGCFGFAPGVLRFAAAMFLLVPAALPALGKQDKGAEVRRGPGLYEAARAGERVEITGRVRLVGSEPFPELVITDGEKRDWYITAKDRPALRMFEQQTVTVRGTLTREEMTLANGRRLDDRRVLSAVELVE